MWQSGARLNDLKRCLEQMLALGIETSGMEGSVALVQGTTILEERQLNQVGRRHAQSLVLEIGEILRGHAFSPSDVNLIAVSRGPGSFTGLRVGMVCAKTFSYATRCRFISVDTFAAIAQNAPADASRVFVIEDAQRDDLFAGEYVREDRPVGSSLAIWRQKTPIEIVGAAEFSRSRTKDDIVMGPGVYKRDLEIGAGNWLKDNLSCRPRASVIACLGLQDFPQGEEAVTSVEADFWRASPFYLRMSAAEEKRATMSLNDR